MVAHRLGLTACLFLLVGSGCESCDEKRETVPFGRDRAASGRDDPPPRDAPEAFEAVVAEQLEPGTREINVAGGRYTAARGAVHLALRLDLEADEDEDAILLVSGEDSLSLVAVRNDRGVLASDSLGEFSLPDGCAFHDGRLVQVDPDNAVVGLRARCAFGDASAGAMITLTPSPRVRKKIWLDAPSSDEELDLSLVFSGADRDDDGHVDLVVAALGEGTPPVELVWLNRPGGFSLDGTEPRETLERAYEAGIAAAETPDVVAAEAGRVRALSAALCREAKMPRLRVDEAFGVPCGRDFLGLAEALRVGALVARGRFDAALEIDRSLREVAEKEVIEALDAAWKKLEAAPIRLERIAAAPEAGGVDEWTAGLLWTDDGALVHRGLLTRRYVVRGDDASAEVVVDQSPPITDLQGRFAVEGVARDCASVRARIVELVPETGAVRPGGVRREIEIAPPEERCEKGATAPRTWEILGWTPQGLVARRGARRRVVPLTVDAEPSGEPFELAADEPLPSPILGPHVTRDGSTRIEPVPGALLLLREGHEPSVVRDETWGEAPAIRSAALSRDGKRIAILTEQGIDVGRLPQK